MKPLAHWLGKFGYALCKCKHCKTTKKKRKAFGYNGSARQGAKQEIRKDLNERWDDDPPDPRGIRARK